MPFARRAFIWISGVAIAAFLAVTGYGYTRASASIPANALANARSLAAGAATVLGSSPDPNAALAALVADQPDIRSAALLSRHSREDLVDASAGRRAPAPGATLPATVDSSVDASASLQPADGDGGATIIAYARVRGGAPGIPRFLRLEVDAGDSVERLELWQRAFLWIALVGSGSIAGLSALVAGRLGRPISALDELAGRLRPEASLLVHTRDSDQDELARIEAHYRQAIDELRRSRAEWETLFHETVQTLASALDQRDGYTGGHSEEVARLSDLVAERLGLSADARSTLRIAAMLHDIGKISVPDSILLKPGPLTPGETAVMRNHVNVGWRLLSRIGALRGVARIAAAHHERFDGTGYPAGLAGPEIPVEARILAAVDAFQAMVSDRVYRPAIGLRRAVEELRRGAGTQFDPSVVDVLVDIVGSRLGTRPRALTLVTRSGN